MKYPRILAAIRAAKWAVRPETLHAIRDVLSARLQGHIAPVSPIRPTAYEEDDRAAPEEAPPYEMAGPGVAVVKLHGIIGKNLSSMEISCGGCDIATVEENLATALAARETTAVILDIDSPGGTVNGVADFAARIEQLSAEAGKPVIAYAAGQCCSAAYWIACGCASICCGSSSDVGSIGVYMALIDQSENWAQEGYKLVLVKAGKYKAAGIAGSKITEEQIALWKAEVDFIYDQFTSAVRAARPSVADETMQGQTFYGPLALAANLVDSVCTFEECVEQFLPSSSPVAN